MISDKMSGRRTSALLAVLLAGLSVPGAAADDGIPAVVPAAPANTTASTAPSQNAQSQNEEIARLQAALAAQQKQLETLQRTLEQQQKLLQSAINASATTTPATSASATTTPNSPSSLGTVASLTPVVPTPAPAPAPAAPYAFPTPMPQKTDVPAGSPCEGGPDANAVPAHLRIGNVCIVPVGFMDLTAVWRDKNAGSGIGSNFGSVPFNNTVNGNLSEFRFSPQNSRIGFRVDGDWKGAHFIGYNEFDFLGTSGSNAITVTNGAFVPRLRLYWVDVRKGKVEFLAGQSWSMLTPNRKGISALPSDLFYTQVMDVNYMVGLTWTRQPGMRMLYHPNDKVTFGVSAENPDSYIGGSGGGSGITLPTAYASIAGNQLDNASSLSTGNNNVLTSSVVAPDIIAKVAFDPNSRFHFEVAGIERNFKIDNPALLSQHSGKTGGGVQLGINGEVIKNVRLFSTNFYSDGGGRYLFGQAPDLIVRGDGSLSLVHASGTVDGVEATVKNTLLFGYYGGVFIGRDSAYDANGKTLIGYGYTGSPNSQNRAINEITFGFNQTMWKDPRYGAFSLIGQYEWLERDPWFVAIGSPKAAHDNTIYFDVRYTLPGSMPNF